jgi:hypothetical protein
MFNFLHHHYFPRLAFIPVGLSPKKTTLFASRLNTLGFEVSEGQLRPSQRHQERFAQWAKPENHPRNVRELEEFLWLTPFLKQYIPGRADLEGALKDAYTTRVQVTTPKGKPSVQRKRVEKPFE